MVTARFAPPTGPDLRVSDAERERVATYLRASAGEGRIDLDELGERLDRAFVARTRAELAPLVGDLPGGDGMLPGARAPRRRPRGRRLVAGLAVVGSLALVAVGVLEAALAAPLELAILIALVAVLAVLAIETVLVSLPTLVLVGLVWIAVQALRRRPTLPLSPR